MSALVLLVTLAEAYLCFANETAAHALIAMTVDDVEENGWWRAA